MTKQIIYDAQMGEVTEVEIEVEDIEIEEYIPAPTTEERLRMAEDTIMFMLMGGI